MEKTQEEGKVPRELQIAFKNLANALIFNRPTEIKISRKNSKLISRKIQQDFYENLIVNIARQKINSSDFLQYPKYQAVSFTPKLSHELEANVVGLNCVGRAIVLGTSMKRFCKETYFGITANHPEVIIHDGDMWINPKMDEAETVYYEVKMSEEREGYRIAKVKNGERPEGNLVIIFDFDNGVLYETLENFAYYRSVALGETEDFLVGTKDYVLDICEKFRKELIAGDWKQLQKILFPEIDKAFQEIDQQWRDEVDFLNYSEREHSLSVRYKNAAIYAENDILKIYKSRIYLNVLKAKIKANANAVLDYMQNSTPLPNNSNKILEIFLTKFKENILKECINEPDLFDYTIFRLKSTILPKEAD